MKKEVLDQQLIKRYLLGKLAEEDKARIEDALLTDSACLNELLILENELVDAYLDGDLSDAEASGFEGYFLATAPRLQKLKFAKVFKRYVRAPDVAPLKTPRKDGGRITLCQSLSGFSRPQNPALGFALATAAILAVIAGTWFVIRSGEDPAMPASIAGKERDQSQSQPEQSAQIAGAVRVISPVLGLYEGNDIDSRNQVDVPTGAERAQLQLKLVAPGYRRYRVEIQTAARGKVWSQENLKPQQSPEGALLAVEVPTELLGPDDYTVTVDGASTGSSPVGAPKAAESEREA